MNWMVERALRWIFGMTPHEPQYTGMLFGSPVCRLCGRPHEDFWRRKRWADTDTRVYIDFKRRGE